MSRSCAHPVCARRAAFARAVGLPWLADADECRVERGLALRSIGSSESLLNSLALASPSTCAVSLAKPLCDDALCRTVQDAQSLYYDEDHLSALGARQLVVPAIDGQCVSAP